MNTIVIKLIKTAFIFAGIIFTMACSENKKSSGLKIESSQAQKIVHLKPPSNYNDTLIIQDLSAVFYEPDSIQLLEIKKLTSPQIYDGSMHEYFYKIKTSRLDLQRNWKHIKIIEAKNLRFLNFRKIDGTISTIDLNNFDDAYGMFIFDGKKDPSLVDLANLNSDLNNYLARY